MVALILATMSFLLEESYISSIAFLHSSASDDFMAAINPGVSLVEDSSLVSTIVGCGTVDNASVDR